MLYLFGLIFGGSYGGYVPQAVRSLGEIVGTRALGTLLGILELGFTIAGALGAEFGGYIFDLTGSYDYGFLAGGILCLLAAAISASSARAGSEFM